MIYVHVPFCRSFCTYCDFYSEVCGGCCDQPQREAALFGRYTDDLCAEIRARRDEIFAASGVRTLYIGGGTPSVLPLDCLRRIVEKLREVEGAALADGADGSAQGEGTAGADRDWEEFTVEVNPEDIVERGPSYVEGLLSLGVNRISMGVQSLDDGMLCWMNRRHSADGARKAWRMLSAAGPLNRSVDLISGVPGMDCAMLERTLDEVLEWRPEHISAYQLSVEEGSALARMIAEGRVTELPDEECRAQYDLICRKPGAAGYPHYEISNWALPGHEAVHNSAYWTRQPYVGLGPGAHSLEITATRQIRKWNSRQATGWKEEGREELSAEEIHEETVMLLARTDRGPIPERDWFIADELIADLL